jgi:hypothetical protein
MIKLLKMSKDLRMIFSKSSQVHQEATDIILKHLINNHLKILPLNSVILVALNKLLSIFQLICIYNDW